MERDKLIIAIGAVVFIALGGLVWWRSQSVFEEPPKVAPPKLPSTLPPPPRPGGTTSTSSEDEPEVFDRNAARNKPGGPARLALVYRGLVGEFAVIEDLESTQQGRYRVGDPVKDATVAEIAKDFVRLTRGPESFTLRIGDETFGRSQIAVKGKTALYPFAMSAESRRLADRMKTLPLNLNFADQPLGDVAQEFGRQLGAKVTLSPSVANSKARITFKVDSLSADQSLSLLLNLWEMAYVLRDGAIIICTKSEAEKDAFTKSLKVADDIARVRGNLDHPAVTAAQPPPNPDNVILEQSLRATRLDLNFTDATTEDFVAFLRDFSQKNIVFFRPENRGGAKDPPKITLDLRNASMEEAIQAAGLAFEIRDGVVNVMTKDDAAFQAHLRAVEDARIREAEGESDRTRRTALGRTFTAAFDSTPLYLAAQEIGKRGRLQVVVQEELWGETPRVTLAGEMSIEQALNSITQSTATRWSIEGGTLYVVR